MILNAIKISLITIALGYISPILAQSNFRGNTELKDTILTAVTIDGSARLKRSNFDSLTINGSLTFDNLTVKDKLNVNGSIQGDTLTCTLFNIDGSFTGKNISATDGYIDGSTNLDTTKISNNLTIAGSLTGDKINVKGKTIVDGNISISDSTLTTLETTSDETLLTNSSTKNITVKKNKDYDLFGKEKHKIQILKLTGKTIIDGDITFLSNLGEVYIDKSSNVTGKITGAKVIKY